MPGECKPETFCLSWKVENFHLLTPWKGRNISTPTFRVGVLQNTKWSMELVRQEIEDSICWGCRLARVSSDQEPELVKFIWTLCLIAEGGTVRFEKECSAILPSNNAVVLNQFIRKSDLLPTDTPQNNLSIFCEITNDPIFSSEFEFRFDFEGLSSDLAWLLESGFRSDFKMYCRGEVFKVHKLIIISRWPNFCGTFEIQDFSTREDMIMTGVDPVTLSAFLSYLYTGKLQWKDLTIDLCTYMHENNCSDLVKNFETPASSLEFITRMHHELKNLSWEVGCDRVWKSDCKDLHRVIPLEKVYPKEMVIKFKFEERNGEEWLKVTLFFIEFSPLSPLLLNGEICFRNKETVVCSTKFNHFLTSDEEWTLPRLVRKGDLLPNKRNSKRVEIQIGICDGVFRTGLVSTNIYNASSFRDVKDLRKLMRDLYCSNHPTDMTLKISDRFYSVHSVVLAARSAKFRELIEQNCEEIEINDLNNVKAEMLLIIHLYGGGLSPTDIDSITELNSLARRYSFAGLEEKTRIMLENRLFDW